MLRRGDQGCFFKWVAKLPQSTLKPLNRREWVHEVVVWTQNYVRMIGMMFLACLYEFDEHHLRFKVYLIRTCCFCVCVKQTNTVTHMGINQRLGTPKIGDTTFQCHYILTNNGCKLQTCLKLSTTLRFLASYVSHKCIFQAQKVVLRHMKGLRRSHGVAEHITRSVSVSSLHHFFGSSIWISLA